MAPFDPAGRADQHLSPGFPDPAGSRPETGGAPPGSDPSAGASGAADLRFARLLALLGLAILGLAAVLLALPILLEGSLLLYLIADGIAFLFGPVGFSLLTKAWRIRNRVRHGTELPPVQRRRLRILGGALVVVGIFLAFSGFGASGTLSRTLNLIWGISLAMYGLRYLFRSFITDRA